MALYCTIVHATNIILHLLCTLVVPIIENIAHKTRIGCVCESHTPEKEGPRSSRRKKLKSNDAVSTTNGQVAITGGDGKRIKVLLDITVRQVGPQAVDIQETTRYVVEDDATQEGVFKKCGKNAYEIIKSAINLPSSIALCATSQVRNWSDIVKDLESSTCGGDPNRVKISPKRRICRSNYRRIIPFFPFNLLGFSNYSAFQMPILTNSSSGSADEGNNLNVSATANGKTRSKRRRHSSADGSSDDDFSHLDISEIAGQPQNIGGHDEVDSDPETETRPISSSTSSSQNQKAQNATTSNTNGKITFDEAVLHDNNVSSNDSEADSKRAVAGDEIHVVSTFLQELDEAANESYNSAEDPDFKPEPLSESGTTSYESGSIESDSYLKSSSTSPEKNWTVNGNGEHSKLNRSPLPIKQEATSTAEDDYKTPEEEER